MRQLTSRLFCILLYCRAEQARNKQKKNAEVAVNRISHCSSILQLPCVNTPPGRASLPPIFPHDFLNFFLYLQPQPHLHLCVRTMSMDGDGNGNHDIIAGAAESTTPYLS
ncbi:hypothetical protein V8C42DRAFT_309851 [Trichoderma barbatum]